MSDGPTGGARAHAWSTYDASGKRRKGISIATSLHARMFAFIVRRPELRIGMDGKRSSDLTRTTLQLLALGVLVATSFWILRPFLVASAWAIMIVVATWPILLGAQAWLGGRRSLAVAAMTTALLLLMLVVPLYLAVAAIVGQRGPVGGLVEIAGDASPSSRLPPGSRRSRWSVAKLAAQWQQLAAGGPEELAVRIAPYAQTLVVWFVGQVGSIGMLLVQFLLTVIIAAILYANGETAARGVYRFARRLAGPQGENALHLAAQAVRAVALGVIVTAIVQPPRAGLGSRSPVCRSRRF